MATASQDFETFQGDAASVTFTVTGSDISTVSDIAWTAHRTLSSAPVISKLKSAGGIAFVTDGTDGKFVVSLTGADTAALSGFYLHEAALIDTNGERVTVATGRMQVGRAPVASYDPGTLASSATYQVRFLLGDTDMTDPQMQDEEIAFAYSFVGSARGAAALCAEALAAKYARLVSVSADGVSMAFSTRSAAFTKLAVELRRKEAIFRAMPYLYGVSLADMRATLSNLDRVPDIFRIGLHDDPPSSSEGLTSDATGDALLGG